MKVKLIIGGVIWALLGFVLAVLFVPQIVVNILFPISGLLDYILFQFLDFSGWLSWIIYWGGNFLSGIMWTWVLLKILKRFKGR